MSNMEMLVSKIEQSGYKKTYLAKQLGISSQAFYNKLQAKSEFTTTETNIMAKVLGLTDSEILEIFFD